MTKKLTKVSLLVVILLLVVTPVLAATYSYYSDISVAETGGNSYTYQPILCTQDIDYLVTNNYINTYGLDTELTILGNPIAYMLTNDKIALVVPSVGVNEILNTRFFMGYDPPQTSFDTIVGNEGYITISDADDLELGDNFEVEFQGYIDTSSVKDIAIKGSAFRIWVSAEEEISASIYNGGWVTSTVTATSILSSVHFVEVTADVQDLKLYINGTLKATKSLGGTVSVPDTNDNWILMQDNVVPYMEFFKIWVD